MAGAKAVSRPFWQWFLPFTGWIGELKKLQVLGADIIAGIALALVLVPQSMAYAQLAGLPFQYGLYASFLPPMVAALFGSSRQLSTGPVAVVSVMSAAALAPLAAGGPEGYLAYAALLAFMVGVFQLFLGVLRLGSLTDFLSQPVVIGFTNAVVVIIVCSQLDSFLGVDWAWPEFRYATLMAAVQTVVEGVHLPTLWMGLLGIALLYGLAMHLPRLLNIPVAVAVTTLLSWYTDFSGAGGAVVGEIPAGLPGFAPPVADWDVVSQLFVAAIVIALVGFAEASSVAKALAARSRQGLDSNQELIGQGLSNLVAGCFSGYPCAGSSSRSAANSQAGAVTGLSSLVASALVGATLVWLTPWLYYLPQATLAAVIIVVAVDLIRVRPVFHAWKAQPHDAVVAVITFALTLYLAPRLDHGVIAGVIISIGLFLYRSMRPRVAVLSRFHDGTMRDVSVHHLPTSPNISIMRFDGSLYFANAGYFESKVLEVVAANPQLRYIILDGEGINQLDATGEEVLHHLAERLKTNRIELLVARMKRQFMDTVRSTGLVEVMGEDHFFSRIQYALNYAWDGLGPNYDRESCPLRNPNL